MAYTYAKLSEVDLIKSANNPNFLIEEDGEIKRIPASEFSMAQVKADWEEEDPNSAAYILNKPDSMGTGDAGSAVIKYELASSLVYYKTESGRGAQVTPENIRDDWNSGATLRLINSGNQNEYNIQSVYYSFLSGSDTLDNVIISYIYKGGYTSTTIY